MYYEPKARITIGTAAKNVVFEAVNKIVIEESIKELGNKATLTLPRNYADMAGKSMFDYIKPADPVLIEIAVNGVYATEFTGFVDQLSKDAPLVINVDDELYPLKRNNHIKAWKKTTLKEVLTFIAPGYTIDCPDINLGTYQISRKSSYSVLLEIAQSHTLYVRIRNGVLVCNFPYNLRTDIEHKYIMGDNVKKSNLKYHRTEDVKIRVKAISNLKNGKKLTYEIGTQDENTSLRTLNFIGLTQEELQVQADALYKTLCFDGLSGTIIGFANPKVHAGDTIAYENSFDPQSNARYLTEKMVLTYDPFGAGVQRECTLSFKI